MSVTINNQLFQIYNYDTIDTIKDRYVTNNRTIPKYADFRLVNELNKKIELQRIGSVDVNYISEKTYIENILEESQIECNLLKSILEDEDIDTIEESSFKNDISRIFSKVRKMFPQLNNERELAILYVIVFESMFYQEDYKPSYMSVQKTIELNGVREYFVKNGVTEREYEIFFNDYKKSYTEIQNRQNRLQIDYQNRTILEKYDTTTVSFLSPVKETQSRYDGSFTLRVDVFELLNKIYPTRDLPFLKIGKFYKILNNFSIPVSWIEPEDETTETLRLYILKNQIESESNLAQPKSESYVTIEIEQNQNVLSSIFIYKYSIVSEEGDLTVDYKLILSRLFAGFQKFNEKPQEMTIAKTFGKGYKIIRGIEFPREVLYDFALNDPIVSSIVSINEIYKIEKIKGGIRFQLFNAISCNLYFKTLDKPMNEEVEMFKGKLNVGDSIIRINISKAKSESHLNQSLDILIRSFLYMIEHQDKLFYEYYTRFIPTIKSDILQRIVVEEESTELKYLFPSIYVSGYQRFCTHSPTAVNEKEAKRLEKEGRDVMLFPLDPEDGPQSWYVSDYRAFPYVGYKRNKLSNAKEYGILPCCYENSQKTKGLRYQYEQKIINIRGEYVVKREEDDEEKGGSKDIIIKTNKILNPERYGILPPNINSLFTSIDPTLLLGENRYLRKGTQRSYRSCITCLLDALDEDIDVDKKLKELVQYNLTSQNMVFPEDALKIIENKEDVDPIQFIAVLENIFRVNIIIFCRNKTDNTNGSFCKPVYKKWFIINEQKIPFLKTVILFRTFGSDIDKVDYPQTELIVLEKSVKSQDKVKSPITKFFSTNSDFIQTLLTMYKSTMNIKNERVEFKNKLTSQLEDNYGKIRVLHFTILNQTIVVYTTPISPIPARYFDRKLVTYMNRPSIHKHSTRIVNEFFKSEPAITDIKKVLYTNSSQQSLVIGYKFTMNQMTGFIYVDDYSDTNDITSEIFSLKNEEYISPLGVGKSLLEQYNENIRLANILVSYSLYLFSIRYNLEEVINSNELFNDRIKELVNNFMKYIVVKTDNEYIDKSRVLALSNSSFIEGGDRLIVTSDEIKKRLLYSVHSFVKNNIYDAMDYKHRRYIPNFYTTPKDFDQDEHYTVYYTKKEFALYNIDPVLIYKSYSFPPYKTEETFFLKNDAMMDGQTFLAQRCSSIENAIFTFLYYQNNRINSSDRDSEGDLTKVNIKLYTYTDQIYEHDIVNNSGYDTVIIFTFKIENEMYTYCLHKYF